MILEGDSKLIVDCLNDIINAPWEIGGIIKNYKNLLKAFSKIKVQHHYREGNAVADDIANQGLTKIGWYYFNFDESSRELKQILAKERVIPSWVTWSTTK